MKIIGQHFPHAIGKVRMEVGRKGKGQEGEEMRGRERERKP